MAMWNGSKKSWPPSEPLLLVATTDRLARYTQQHGGMQHCSPPSTPPPPPPHQPPEPPFFSLSPLARVHPAPCRVKSYEGKLATLTAINSALQSENGELRQQLDAAATPTTATGAVLLPCISAAGRGIGSSAASAHNQLALLSAAGASHADQRSCLSTAACLPACLPATLPSTLPACPPAGRHLPVPCHHSHVQLTHFN